MEAQAGPDLVQRLVAMIADLCWTRMDLAVIPADENVIELEFGEPVVEFRAVGEGKQLFEVRGKPQLFLQPAAGGRKGVFPGSGVAATGIGPQAGAMVFARGAAL